MDAGGDAAGKRAVDAESTGSINAPNADGVVGAFTHANRADTDRAIAESTAITQCS